MIATESSLPQIVVYSGAATFVVGFIIWTIKAYVDERRGSTLR